MAFSGDLTFRKGVGECEFYSYHTMYICDRYSIRCLLVFFPHPLLPFAYLVQVVKRGPGASLPACDHEFVDRIRAASWLSHAVPVDNTLKHLTVAHAGVRDLTKLKNLIQNNAKAPLDGQGKGR